MRSTSQESDSGTSGEGSGKVGEGTSFLRWGLNALIRVWSFKCYSKRCRNVVSISSVVLVTGKEWKGRGEGRQRVSQFLWLGKMLSRMKSHEIPHPPGRAVAVDSTMPSLGHRLCQQWRDLGQRSPVLEVLIPVNMDKRGARTCSGGGGSRMVECHREFGFPKGKASVLPAS